MIDKRSKSVRSVSSQKVVSHCFEVQDRIKCILI